MCLSRPWCVAYRSATIALTRHSPVPTPSVNELVLPSPVEIPGTSFPTCIFGRSIVVTHSPLMWLPEHLNETLNGNASLRSASRRDLDVPRTRLKFGERAFCVAAPLVWNRLPSDIRDISSTPLFKKKLKTYLFSAAYPAA